MPHRNLDRLRVMLVAVEVCAICELRRSSAVSITALAARIGFVSHSGDFAPPDEPA